eukprot:TRINITY_DN2513_c0_g2_i1.p1 TRINITY_DN2513_c0_g2~~TRINITY_DN2513_c0_g2_i1.p1  ORF type:complete len:349 (+),score=77.90 TRINITY_DN2513_c0_g2_i1:47-1048(+)
MNTISYGSFANMANTTLAFPSNWTSVTTAIAATNGSKVDTALNGGLAVVLTPAGSVTQSVTYNAALGNASSVELTTLSNPTKSVTVVLPSSNVSYTLAPGAVKFSLRLNLAGVDSYALFGSASNSTFEWGCCFISDEGLGQYNTNYTVVNATQNVMTYVFKRANAMLSSSASVVLQLNIAGFATADGRPVAVDHTIKCSRNVSTTTAGKMNNSTLHLCVTWTFGRFNQSLFYDPDMSVLVLHSPPSDSNDNNNSNNDSSSTDLRYIVIPTVVGGVLALCCVMLLLLAMAVVARRLYQNRMLRRNLADSVSYDGHEIAEKSRRRKATVVKLWSD